MIKLKLLSKLTVIGILSLAPLLQGCGEGWNSSEKANTEDKKNTISGSEDASKNAKLSLPSDGIPQAGTLSIQEGAEIGNDTTGVFIGLPDGVTPVTPSIQINAENALDASTAGTLVLSVPVLESQKENVDADNGLSLLEGKSLAILHHTKRKDEDKTKFGIRPISIATKGKSDVEGDEITTISFSLESGIGNHQVVLVDKEITEAKERTTDHEILNKGETYESLGLPEEQENENLLAPANVTATAEDGKIIIAFDEVDGASSYNLYITNASGVSKDDPKTENITSPYEFTKDLLSGLDYYFVVAAVNDDGVGKISEEVSAKAK